MNSDKGFGVSSDEGFEMIKKMALKEADFKDNAIRAMMAHYGYYELTPGVLKKHVTCSSRHFENGNESDIFFVGATKAMTIKRTVTKTEDNGVIMKLSAVNHWKE